MSDTTETSSATRPTLNSVPFFSIILRPVFASIQPIWKAFCAFRWLLSRPLNTLILPKFVPGFVNVPILKHVPHICIGEILFAVPAFVIAYLSYEASFGMKRSTDKSGYIASYSMYVIFFTANKANSLVTFVLGIPFERLIFWHKLWSIVVIVTGIFHFFCAYDRGGDEGQTNYSKYGPEPNIGKFAFEGEYQITGSLLFISLILLVVPSILSIFRRLYFDIWYYSHVILATAAVVLVVIHGTLNLLIVLAWWVVDLGTRYLLMTGRLYPREASLRAMPGDIVEISFPKTDALEYDPGQFLMISIPKLGFSQFHPFSISSSPNNKFVTMHTKSIGGWTQRLMELAKKESKVNILIEGPYGNLAVDINDSNRYKTVVLIAGGIGVTPLLSVANDLLQQVQNGREMTKIRFVWTIRSPDILQTMKDKCDLEDTSGVSLLDDRQSIDALQLDVYVTGSKSKGATVGNIVTCMGRPNIDQIFSETKEAAKKKGEGTVAVLVCGPMGMIDECRDASRRWSDACGGIKFDFHEEKFLL
mmetsp:Transcript_6505/g.12247  ORF Transcript_6505/g.12247 Transcript_6505/m.12247 type:complete len:532 (-) Transcript_6505:118-1713(-)